MYKIHILVRKIGVCNTIWDGKLVFPETTSAGKNSKVG